MTKSKLTVIILLVILLAVGYWVWMLLPHTAGPHMGNVEMITVATSSPYSTATGTYPQFRNAPVSFNREISGAVDRAIAEQMTSSEENWNARYETAIPSDNISQFPSESDKFPLTVGATIERNDAHMISLLMEISEYSGGAHGQTVLFTFNYDLGAEKDITLNDLMKGDSQFLQKLSVESRTILKDELAHNANVTPEEVDASMLNDGTTPVAANFSLFTLTSDTDATFYFNEYQVAAYVFGTPEIHVTLPLK